MKRMHALATALAFAALTVSALAAAAVTDIATTPLASSASNLVKPNVSFVLDTSGSMAWGHAPDESEPFFNKVGYKASQCNTIYYDPNIILIAECGEGICKFSIDFEDYFYDVQVLCATAGN